MRPSNVKTVNINPGAITDTFTNAVAKAGEKPAERHTPILKPTEALVKRIFGGNFSTSQAVNGPQKKERQKRYSS